MRKFTYIVGFVVIAFVMLVPQSVPAGVDKPPPPAKEYLIISATNRYLHVIRCGHFTEVDTSLVMCGELDIIRLSDMHRMEPDGSWTPLPIS